ncbi:APC family permease [Sulfuracidifex tepidarius]|uniref:Amino acid permease/ SLC12A domain-containing protein n=1 Tax=Sulfuracidifex tepidarius TaxID=1294262 RepID=A0A510DVT2_9CREN|nr:APC family permease [Sulfuracidifex tepidarius]BBG24305.1 hypothetical protein IC006_1615 [Sulfuracidifex tepidarius]BBG27062.1 hypothetical protein IC007_1592 [Sulfuracidifex tepidarius]
MNSGETSTNYDKQLKKSLSRLQMLYLSLGGIIGSGWLFGSLYADSVAGPASVLSWIIGGILVLFIGLTYAEIASAIPRSGGTVRYPHYSHGGFVGFFMAWSYLLAISAEPAIEATAVVTYMSLFLPSLVNHGYLTLEGLGLAYLLLAIFFLINYMGVNALGKVSHGAGWWKLIVPAITVLLIIAFSFHPSNFTVTNFAPYGASSVLIAIPTTGVIFAYLGFRQAIEYGGEGKNPQKDIPFAVVGSILISVVLYTLLQVAFTGGINWSTVKYVNSKGVPTFTLAPGNWSGLVHSTLVSGPFYLEITNSPVVGLLLTLFTIWSAILIIDAIISPSGSAWIYVGSGARTVYGFAASGYFPPILMRLGKNKVPVLSLIVSIILGGVFLLPFPAWQILVSIISSASVFTYIMGGIALESLRRNAPCLDRPFRLKNSRILAPLATISAGLIIYWAGFSTLFYVFTAAMLGLPIFYVYYAHKSLKLRKSTSMLLSLLDIVGIPALSWYLFVSTNSLTTPNNLAFVTYILGIALLLLVNVTLSVKHSKNSYRRREMLAGVWLPAYLVSMYILSYFGSFGLFKVITFPTDVIAAALLTLGAHYAAVTSSMRTRAIDEIIEASNVEDA